MRGEHLWRFEDHKILVRDKTHYVGLNVKNKNGEQQQTPRTMHNKQAKYQMRLAVFYLALSSKFNFRAIIIVKMLRYIFQDSV
jgi:hypothetical protein